jgi:hypothetical protein
MSSALGVGAMTTPTLDVDDNVHSFEAFGPDAWCAESEELGPGAFEPEELALETGLECDDVLGDNSASSMDPPVLARRF